jgi:phosphotransferase system enzyme I (PtsI)
MRLIAKVARYGQERGLEVSLCGDAGGDPAILPHLLKAGLRTVSMAPSAVARAKAIIAETDFQATAVAAGEKTTGSPSFALSP